MRKLLLAASLATFAFPAFAADLPVKAQIPSYSTPFATAAGSGWYVGLGTEAGVASSNVNGNLFATNLVGGGLTADGAAISLDAGYIRGTCFLGTWCQVELDVKYQDISGSNAIGSINSRWGISEEFDVGAELFQTVFAALPTLGSSGWFPSFNPSGLLPSNVAVALTPPRQYFGFVSDEILISGNVGSASGQTWSFAPGVTTGYRWQTLGTNGQPNDGSLKIFAKIEWPTKGVDLSGVFAGPGGAPLTASASAQMSTLYSMGLHYDFGL